MPRWECPPTAPCKINALEWCRIRVVVRSSRDMATSRSINASQYHFFIVLFWVFVSRKFRFPGKLEGEKKAIWTWTTSTRAWWSLSGLRVPSTSFVENYWYPRLPMNIEFAFMWKRTPNLRWKSKSNSANWRCFKVNLMTWLAHMSQQRNIASKQPVVI